LSRTTNCALAFADDFDMVKNNCVVRDSTFKLVGKVAVTCQDFHIGYTQPVVTHANSGGKGLLRSLPCTMKSFAILLSLVSLITATPLAYDYQSPLTAQITSYPGFDYDLNALRLVQLEGHDPVWMTELEKVKHYNIW